MKNEFRLGLVAEIKDGDVGGSRVIKSKDWNYFFNFFREKGDVVLFDWKNVGSDFNVCEYAVGSRDSFDVLEEKADIRELCDIMYIGQLGKIYERRETFLGFLDILEKFPGQVINPIETIKGNLSKHYLLELQDKGISVIPTVDVSNGYGFLDLERLEFPNYGKSIDDLVLKPKIFGEQGNGVVRLSEIGGEEGFQGYLKRHKEAIAQPLIDDIYFRGEDSFVFTGRKFSHGLNKVTGNFKINFCNSSRYSSKEPSADEMALCQSVFDAWPSAFGYARIDIVPSDKPLIGEVEMVNPAGYLAEVNAFEKYSQNLNKRIKEIHEGRWK